MACLLVDTAALVSSFVLDLFACKLKNDRVLREYRKIANVTFKLLIFKKPSEAWLDLSCVGGLSGNVNSNSSNGDGNETKRRYSSLGRF